ncbi:transmembrane protein 145, partial [Agrilus planipennis]|uniref:Transmembrane protein 145 n=1 Tax=Agrilus planipennis TaxID=224129 RepID=A0A1W4WRT5_AGRPL
MYNFLTCFVIFNIFYLTKVRGKYVEGEINTKDDWAFLARFCFLSEEGQFEYRIEFNEEQGYPNLLLYYDTDDQWPSVYKSGKTCPEKESVLKIGQNQVVNLTVKTIFHQEFSGCVAVEVWKPPVTTSSTTTQFPTKKHTEPISVKKTTSSTLTPTSTTNFPTPKFTTTTTRTTTSKPMYLHSTTDFSTEIWDNFNDSNTPELYDYNDESMYHNFQDDVENIFPSDDKNDTGPIEVYTTIESSPRKKRSIIKNTTPKQQRHDRRIICQNSRRFRSSRERWWFIAISNCGGNKGINVKYKLLMTNGPPGDYWHEHFSADEFYVLPVLLAYSVAYSFLLLAVIVCTIELKARQLLHSTYKLFTSSVIIQFFGVVFKTLAYMKFAFNGLGSPKLKTFGEILMACSETCFLLVLILLAKGYTVTRGRLSVKSGVKVTIFMCIYSVTYICLFVYQEKVFDPGEVLYLYESPAGYGLIFLKILAWIMFIYSTIITLKHYPEKSNFYYPFNVFGTFWFVAGPAFILSANTYIDKWVRESVVNAVLLLITFGGHLMFLVLTMPSRANKNFP